MGLFMSYQQTRCPFLPLFRGMEFSMKMICSRFAAEWLENKEPYTSRDTDLSYLSAFLLRPWYSFFLAVFFELRLKFIGHRREKGKHSMCPLKPTKWARWFCPCMFYFPLHIRSLSFTIFHNCKVKYFKRLDLISHINFIHFNWIGWMGRIPEVMPATVYTHSKHRPQHREPRTYSFRTVRGFFYVSQNCGLSLRF